MVVPALAKINLSLRVLGVRADGYHELRTIFQSIALHDTVRVRRSRGPFSLECDDPACPADTTNLVWRAAQKVWLAAGKRGDVRDLAIHLTKRIPMQAGLGGGSSDAAAAIRGVGKMLKVESERFPEIAASLGADVPYFLQGGTVLGLDRGDVLFPLIDEPAAWVVLVIPNFGVSTKDAYEWLDEERQRGAAQGGGINDLEAAVTAHHPEIGCFVRALAKAGAARAAMTGSGSTVFGLFKDRQAAQRAARTLTGRGVGTVLTRTVNRMGYQRLAGIAPHRINLPIAPRRLSHS